MNAEKKEGALQILDDLKFLFNALILTIEEENKQYLILDDPKTTIRKHAHKITDEILLLKGFIEEIPE